MQRYHSSFISYIKGRSDFQVKGLERERGGGGGGGERGRERKRKREREREREKEKEREREREKVRLLIETVLQYSLLMLSSRRGPSIDVLDNIRLITSTDDSVLCIFLTDPFI